MKVAHLTGGLLSGALAIKFTNECRFGKASRDEDACASQVLNDLASDAGEDAPVSRSADAIESPRRVPAVLKPG